MVWMILDICGMVIDMINFLTYWFICMKVRQAQMLIANCQNDSAVHLHMSRRLSSDNRLMWKYLPYLTIRVKKRERPGCLNVLLGNRVSPTFRVYSYQKPHIHMDNTPRESQLLPVASYSGTRRLKGDFQ